MSYISAAIIPDEDDLTGFGGVRGKLDLKNGIPSLVFAKGFQIQFSVGDPDFAVRYLTKIAEEAQAVADAINEARS